MADPVGERMKGYEESSENVLPARLPVIVRLDGNSFSRLTKGLKLEKPFDARFERAMDEAARAVCEYADGARLAYVQSDEISVLLTNDRTHDTQPFLANRTQKLTSLLAATASVAFNQAMADEALPTSAVFDARVFVVPPAEVNNVFLWRQLDAFRNCVGAYAYYELADKYGRKTAARMLHGKGTDERQEIIFSELDVNINDLPAAWRRGRVLLRRVRDLPIEEVVDGEVLARLIERGQAEAGQMVTRSAWEVDGEPPRFNHDPDYIERHLVRKEE